MEEKIMKFVIPNSFAVLVNASFRVDGVSTSSLGYVPYECDVSSLTVVDFLKSLVPVSTKRILSSLQLVKLKSSVHMVSMSSLTRLEVQKVFLALCLLLGSKVIVCERFFEGMIYSEQEYFKRFFRNMMSKKDVSFVLFENDMNFVVECVSKFYLFYPNGRFRLISDFYDDRIYKYVEMPFTVELVRYFESCGHEVDHDYTFSEVLKAIYRGVK